MKRLVVYIAAALLSIPLFADEPDVDAVLDDIYRQLTELDPVESGELQEELLQYVSNPFDINTATEDDLRKLHFLSDNQIDAILTYVYKHPMESLNELDLIPELPSYQARNLRVFVSVKSKENDNHVYAKDVFHYAKHEIIARTDVRNIEAYENDPVFAQLKYKFNYNNRVQFGVNISRAAGVPAKDMRYGAYLELKDIAPHVKTIVAGNYQASFGQGLVLNTGFHQGKNSYVMTVGNAAEGLRKYSSAGIASLHGVGTTLTFGDITKLKTELSVLYSLNRSNDSLWHHVLGSHIGFRHKQLAVGMTFAEHLYNDSVHYYRNMAYNRNYFRGTNQAIIGADFRYCGNWYDIFVEVAAAQNKTWGWATEVGCRFTPVSDVGLIVLYRYYSPTFDNTLAYAFSETTRINDENGLYLGTEISRLKNWIFRAYGDVFRFSGPKYGINYSPSWGYDAMGEADWKRTDSSHSIGTNIRFRAKEKAQKSTYALRLRFTYDLGGWSFRTQGDVNLVQDSVKTLTYGYSISQDIHYSFAKVPLTLQLRLQGFHANNWDNRIYVYENDVLYALSIPSSYGVGGRAYLNLRWRIIDQLSLYLKVSETVYSREWAQQRDIPQTRTDIHLLLRAYL